VCVVTAANAGITPRNVLSFEPHSRKDFIKEEAVVGAEEATMTKTNVEQKNIILF
jgi:hypothetical protein